MVTYAVVTNLNDSENFAFCGEIRVDGQAWGKPRTSKTLTDWLGAIGLDPMYAIYFRQQVWTLGEIVILDGEYGREVCGAMRKPSKWFIEVEHFDDIEKAIERSREITG